MVYNCSCKLMCAQSCMTLRNPIDCSPPDSSVHGIFQARILEWVAIPFSSCYLGVNPSVAGMWGLLEFPEGLTRVTSWGVMEGLLGPVALFFCLAASGLSCATQDLPCFMRDLLLCSEDSLVVVLRLSCSKACGILVPRLGIEPVSLHCKADS